MSAVARDDLNAATAALTTQIAQGFAHVTTRVNDVVAQLDRMNGKVTDAHVKIGAHHAAIHVVQEGIKILRERSHEQANEIKTITSTPSSVRVSDLRWYLWIAGGSIGGLLALLRLVGKL